MTGNPYINIQQIFEVHFNGIIRSLPEQPRNLYEPCTYFLGLGGKRLRPLLAFIATDCFNGDLKISLPAASATELFHNFSLIHDDIMDKAPLRRGKPTVHEKWNPNIAILSGDILLVKAYQELAKSEKELLPALEKIFSATAIEVCEGQQMDMDFETRDNVNISEYMEMIRLKTAVLLACSLKMGVINAGASVQDADLFYRAGEKLGIAFQLTDDFLDAFGNPEQVGKQTGGDIVANKKTWMLIKATELAYEAQKAELQKWLSTNDKSIEKIENIKNIFTALNIHQLIQQEIDTHYNEAVALLKQSAAVPEKINAFTEFIKGLMHRNK